MLFNSINFALFLPIVFILYWFATKKNPKLQNILLLISSYFFYASWDYRFLFLLIFSTLLDYFTALKMYDSKNQNLKKKWFWLSIVVNLGFLGVFKYYNFFSSTFSEALSYLGIKAEYGTLEVILPVGISFYTFHGLSYVIDIYRNRIEPERDLVNYAVFVSFFPLLVAGPIERATHLLPQIREKREFSYSKAIDGLRQILWGFFKKVVIADNSAEYANSAFNNSGNYHGTTLVLGALFFAIQIYADFSGYSDIALGTARLFGIDLLRNFAFPYFSRDIAEFWRRWNISLSTWFRDYLYIPLGGSKGGLWMKVKNTLIIFLVSGFWHGANWTFILWGLLNAIYIMPSILLNTNRNNLDIVAKGKYLPTLKDFLSITITFCLTVFGWIFFRANSIGHAFRYIKSMFTSLFNKSDFVTTIKLINLKLGLAFPLLLISFVLIEWFGRERQYALSHWGMKYPKPVRWAFYYTLVISIFYFAGPNQQFIYFQF